MIDLTMRVKFLPTPYIITNFVGGEGNCNYEIYLRELLNSSAWFSAHYPGGFTKPSSESNGECDAINQNYKIDFKLFVSTTSMCARSNLTSQVYKTKNGSIIWSQCKNSNWYGDIIILHAALREKPLEEFYKIRNKKTRKDSVEKDISIVLKKLETKKNLLLFFPYEFVFDSFHSFDEAMKSISYALTGDFHVAFRYRECETQGQYDTFITCVYEHSFLIFKFENQCVQLIDSVKISDMPTFLQLGDYVDL